MPPSVTSSEARIAGQLWAYVAPVATAFPATITTDPASPWKNLGAIEPNTGVLTPSLAVTKFLAHQTSAPIRTGVTDRQLAVGFTLQQTNEVNVAAAWGGGSFAETSVGSGIYRFTPPAAEEVWERAMLLDVLDGAVKTRYYFDRVSIETLGALTLSKEALQTYAISLAVLAGASGGGAGWYFETNDAAFAP
jgi:hypothetical protein